MIRILDRYIGRDFLRLFALTLTVLVAISILVNLFDRLHHYITAGASASRVMRYYFFRIPQETLRITPMALLIASFLTVGRFKRHYELLAMQVARVHPLRAVLPIIVLALAITVSL
jgi:lipopolysaccharide export system permease protein